MRRGAAHSAAASPAPLPRRRCRTRLRCLSPSAPPCHGHASASLHACGQCADIRASPPGLVGGGEAARFFFTDSGLGPLALLRLNCTFVCTRVAAPGSSCSACRSCAGTTPRVSCAARERTPQTQRTQRGRTASCRCSSVGSSRPMPVLCTKRMGTPCTCSAACRDSASGACALRRVATRLAQPLAQLLVLRAYEEVLRVAVAHGRGDALSRSRRRLQPSGQPVQPPRSPRRLCARSHASAAARASGWEPQGEAARACVSVTESAQLRLHAFGHEHAHGGAQQLRHRLTHVAQAARSRQRRAAWREALRGRGALEQLAGVQEVAVQQHLRRRATAVSTVQRASWARAGAP